MGETAPTLIAFLAAFERVAGHRPWPRFVLDEAGWRRLVDRLAVADWSLVGLWAAPAEVHLALRDEETGEVAVASLACPGGRYPAVSPVRPSAQRLERAARDLAGVVADGAVDGRPWLDHGRWRESAPLAAAPGPAPEPTPAAAYPFLAVEGEGLHQIPVGPVHAGIIEPGHFRFHANGEAVARLEERLGYVHKGTERLMQGLAPAAAARLAARVSGDSTVAHSLAFARAVEAALGIEAPPRAAWMRALMAELERIANHLGDIGAVCNDAAFAFMHAHSGVLRERVLRVSGACFGHRLMMDRVVPGGVASDLAREGRDQVLALVREIAPRFRHLVSVYDNKTSLLDRTTGTGVVARNLVHRFAAGGFVGRASGRPLDARRNPGYPPYDALDFDVPVRLEGDVNSRVWIRIKEVEASLELVEQIVTHMPAGAVAVDVPARAGEGLALVEGFRGEIMTWVRLDSDGRVERCHPRDPSWLQWPLLEAAIEDNIVADFPLCNKSFNCSYSGHDL